MFANPKLPKITPVGRISRLYTPCGYHQLYTAWGYREIGCAELCNPTTTDRGRPGYADTPPESAAPEITRRATSASRSRPAHPTTDAASDALPNPKAARLRRFRPSAAIAGRAPARPCRAPQAPHDQLPAFPDSGVARSQRQRTKTHRTLVTEHRTDRSPTHPHPTRLTVPLCCDTHSPEPKPPQLLRNGSVYFRTERFSPRTSPPSCHRDPPQNRRPHLRDTSHHRPPLRTNTPADESHRNVFDPGMGGSGGKAPPRGAWGPRPHKDLRNEKGPRSV